MRAYIRCEVKYLHISEKNIIFAHLFFKDKTHPRYAELRSRWNAQFKNGGDAFLNEGKSKNVVYGMFPVFVRMVFMKEKKGEMSAAEQA